MKLIPLSQGQFAKVDDDDFGWLSQWKWKAYYDPTIRGFYAIRHEVIDNRRVTVRMHRFILGLARGDRMHGEHENHDTLDNQRHNLRIANCSQNAQNRRKRYNSFSSYKGIDKLPSNRWRATIWSDKRLQLGVFNTPEEAARAYDKAARELFGRFACVNFPASC